MFGKSSFKCQTDQNVIKRRRNDLFQYFVCKNVLIFESVDRVFCLISQYKHSASSFRLILVLRNEKEHIRTNGSYIWA